MSSTAGTMKTIGEREGVTSISANARIDYILRFSQHAVLVIDEDTELCTQVGNRFLGALTKDHNAAYVSLSSKLNDIQIRCRIIEQLFGSALFDPEQPISVNIIKLSGKNDEVITIVIGNSEYMSLQLFNELCQLSETANKLKRTVNVVFLGSVEAGQLIADNYALFDKKLSIIQASNGQLIGLNSSVFKNKSVSPKKTMIKVSFLIIALAIILMYLSGFWDDKVTPVKDTAQSLNDKFVKVSNDSEVISSSDAIDSLSIATSQEVFHFLTLPVINTSVTTDEILKDEPIVINQTATLSTSNKVIAPKGYTADELSQLVVIDNVEAESKVVSYSLDEAYYKLLETGVVIQFASFEKIDGFQTFINTYPDVEFKGYARKINDVKSHIVTSKVFNTTAEAKLAISNLIQDLKARGPWIKPVKVINKEINLYQEAK